MADQKQQLSKPRSWDEMFPGRFLKAGLLLDGNATYTIADVVLDKIEGDKGIETKGIIRFREVEQELALNKTNGLCLKAMFGAQIHTWTGKRITLMPDKTKFGAETVDCIRIHGSPDITSEIQVRIKHPKKREFFMTMHCGARNNAGNAAGNAKAPSPTAADYEACDSLQKFTELEKQRREANNRDPALVAAKDAAKTRLMAQQQKPAEPREFDQAAVLLRLQDAGKAKDELGIQSAWDDIFKHFDAAGTEIPIDLEAAYHHAKEQLAQ